MRNCFQEFKSPIAGIELPENFTFPFYYEPHPLAKIAADELKAYLETQNDFNHNFGLNQHRDLSLIIGKMFGVLVVKTPEGKLGYLAAFSGKLANENHHTFFVPPVFDILTENGFFREEEEIVNQINFQIEQKERDPYFVALGQKINLAKKRQLEETKALKEKIKANKSKRKALRAEKASVLSENDLFEYLEILRKESVQEQYFLKDFIRKNNEEIEALQTTFQLLNAEIEALKLERKQKSNQLQHKIFDHYSFLNQRGELKSLSSIFHGIPPAGTGECAAPKLLHYAYLHQYAPIALAEFWWGEAPKSEVRLHGQFYPACKSKCEPLLGHMLQGLNVDPNPLLINPAVGKDLPIVYEDEYLLAVNKPAEFLSVPGIYLKESVYSRIKDLYPEATGPLLVHRLDMSTSGILLIAKDKEVHKKIQRQFIQRKIDKKYIALLDGIPKTKEGKIELPLRVDLDDRPRQMVCYEHGKKAVTLYQVIEIKAGRTKIAFKPITGRTHQLRVHAAHTLGLNTPIVGDDLYGTKSNRLYLHAASLSFLHPITKEQVIIEVPEDF